MTEQAIAIRGVRKRLGRFELDIAELTLERGYVLGLVGRNGAGKSTTIKVLLNLIYPERGEVEVLGLRQPEAEIAIKHRVGYVSETPAFYDDVTVGWTARLVSRYYPAWNDQAYKGYLNKFDLDPRKKVGQLSKGMRMKLALTLALSHNPELLILDEPTSGLDPVVRRELLEEIAALMRDERRAVVFSSHITPDVEQVADYVAVLDGGRVVEEGVKEDLLEQWKRVSGVADKPEVVLPRDEFLTMDFQGRSFAGVANRFSPDLLERLRQRGAGNLQVHNLNLDEILVTLAGKEA